MIADIRRLAQPGFYPGTEQLQITGALPSPDHDLLKLDLSEKEPRLIYEDSQRARISHADGAVFVRPATDEELKLILEWLQVNPQHPETLTPAEVNARFTDDEYAIISAKSPRYARTLFSENNDIRWTVYAEAIEKLHILKVLSSESRARHLGQGPV